MTIQPKHWSVSPRAPQSHFAKFADLQPLVVQLLYNRGLSDRREVDEFINHYWEDDDPFNLKGMTETVARVEQAIARSEAIAIYGDYDVDGVTATALMIQLLTGLGAQVRPYIPNRFDEGYGLNNEALSELAGQGIKLVLTVDCGIRSVAEVAHGNSLGLDIIITDHHSVGEQLPPAHAIINPKQPGCAYRYKELAGVGLAYKLAQALLSSSSLNNPHALHAEQFLDLVALGTVADLAPLYGENRRLAALGLQRLNQSLRPGLQALLTQGDNKAPSEISAGTIGFVIGPRLNAAGRLDSAWAAYKLLMAESELQALHLAQQLNLQNRERQALTRQMADVAREIVLDDEARSPLYLVSNPTFNPGVVGLVASRIVEEFYRPTLIAEQGPEQTKGSARSIAEFHITAALDQCADLLERYGGHAAAAGFTVRNENLPALQNRLLEIAATQLEVSELQPTITIDGEVNLRGVKPPLIEAILSLQPFGIGNPTPRFMTRNLQIKACRTVGQDNTHLKLTLFDGKKTWSAIAFRQGEWLERLRVGQYIDVVYNLEFNEWQGRRTMQLLVRDLRPSEMS